jgi:hypothetical protein
MSARQFRGKPCVYCSGAKPATTGDHVFARLFFPVAERANLPQVPACGPCNNDKAKQEAYLMAVLPFGGRHAGAVSDLATMVPPRLAKNKKLHRRLAQQMKEEWQMSPGGVLMPAMGLPFDPTPLERWAEYVVRGLIFHHWKVMIPPSYVVAAACLSSAGAGMFAALFTMHTRSRVNGNLGDGRFVYRGVQASDDAALTLWEISPLSGAVLGNDPNRPGEFSTKLGVITGSQRIGDSFASLGISPASPIQCAGVAGVTILNKNFAL